MSLSIHQIKAARDTIQRRIEGCIAYLPEPGVNVAPKPGELADNYRDLQAIEAVFATLAAMVKKEQSDANGFKSPDSIDRNFGDFPEG